MSASEPRDLGAILERLKQGRLGEPDIAALQAAVQGGQLTIQTGGVNFGQSNQIQIRGSVIGSLTLTLPSAAEAARLLNLLQPFRPEPPPPEGVLSEPGWLPPGSRMPFSRNAVFTGREVDLLEIEKRLLLYQEAGTVGSSRVVAATGEGGLGKTQLAVEFCYRFGRYFHGVHWIQAPSATNPPEEGIGPYLSGEIAACGAEMGLEPWPEPLPEQMQITLREWKRGGPRLVVWDNVEDEQLVQAWLPQLGNVRLLLTSRRQDWPPDMANALLLDSLARPESLRLLRKLAPRLEKAPEAALNQIAEQLGDLPLALDLAGRYLHERRSLSPAGFLEELREAGGALDHSALRDWSTHNPTRHDTNLAGSFLLSWERVESEEARRLFCACGYCAPNTPIPWLVFQDLAGKGDSAAVDRALGTLEDLGLVRLAEQGVVIHPLLAEFARLQDKSAQPGVLEPLAEVLGVLSFDALDSRLPERFKPLRTHIETVATAAELAKLPGAGALWGHLGSHLDDVADYATARAVFEHALALDEAAFGPDNPDVAAHVSNLGGVFRELGDYPAARAAYERALAIDKAALGPNHPKFATDLNNLGLVLAAMGDYPAARDAFESALRIDEAAYGPEHPDVARDISNLGTLFRALGDYPNAKIAYERALGIWEKILGVDHPYVATATNNLSLVLRMMGDYAAARAASERALTIWEQTLGADHPNVATALNNLGEVLRDMGDQPAAIAAYQRALAISERSLGPDHRQVGIELNNLGLALYALDDLLAAREALERALAVLEGRLPAQHPEVERVRENLEQVEMEIMKIGR